MSDFGSSKPFDDGYLGLDPRLESRRFDDSFRAAEYSEEHFPTEDEHKEDGYDMVSDAPISFENGFNSEDHHGVHLDSPSPFDESYNSEHPDFTSRGGEFSPTSDLNGHSFPAPDDGYEFMEHQQAPLFGSGDGSVLPPPEEMEPEEGFLLREWKRQNAERLAEKEEEERQRLSMIMDDADAIKDEYRSKRVAHCEAQRKNNRDKEKVFLSNQTHFHETADKHYWKAVSELIPTEVATIDKKRGKDKEKKNAAVVLFNQGPKPGKPTDMSRMRQVLLKLKHNPPAHMKTAPPPPPPKAEGEKAAAGAAGDKATAQPASTPAVEAAA